MKPQIVFHAVIAVTFILLGSIYARPSETSKKTVVDIIHISGSVENEGAVLDPLLLSIKLQRELERTEKLVMTPRSRAFIDLESRLLSEEAKYSAADAARIGKATGNQQVVQGYIRYFGTQVWVVIGLFDVKTASKINEVGAFCENTGRNIIDQVIPDLARQLVGMKAESTAEPRAKAGPALKSKPNYLKWTFLGIILASTVVFIERLSSPSETTPPPAADRVEMVLQW